MSTTFRRITQRAGHGRAFAALARQLAPLDALLFKHSNGQLTILPAGRRDAADAVADNHREALRQVSYAAGHVLDHPHGPRGHERVLRAGSPGQLAEEPRRRPARDGADRRPSPTLYRATRNPRGSGAAMAGVPR